MTPRAKILWMAGSVGVTALIVLGWQMIANYSGIPAGVHTFAPGGGYAVTSKGNK